MAACPECGADPVRVGQVRRSRAKNHWVPGFQCDACGKIRTLTDDDPQELHDVSKAIGDVIKKRIIFAAVAEQFLFVAGAGIGWLLGSWVTGLVVAAFIGTLVIVPSSIVMIRRRHLN